MSFVAVTVQPPGAPAGTPFFGRSTQIRLLHEFGDSEATEQEKRNWAYEETLRWVESMGLDDWAVEFSVPLVPASEKRRSSPFALWKLRGYLGERHSWDPPAPKRGLA